MKIRVIRPSGEFLFVHPDAETFLEACGRTCYKSEDRITPGSAQRFVSKICRNRHESVLEHGAATARIVCSRACSHQLVRHRIGAYSQESQRYVNYQKKGYEVILPPSWGVPVRTYGDFSVVYDKTTLDRLTALRRAFQAYEDELKASKPEDARYLLPNAAKTEIVCTYNFRTWRHIFRERALNPHAQWEIRSIFLGLYEALKVQVPSIFDDLEG